MGQDFQEKSQLALKTEQQVIGPVQKYIESVHSHPGIIDCITWTGMAEEQLLNYGFGEKLPGGAKVNHCVYESATERHHWLEVTFSGLKKRIYIWDGSKQKLPGGMFINKQTPGLWHGFTAKDVRRQQIYPEIVE